MSTAPPPGAPSASARCPVCGTDVYREEREEWAEGLHTVKITFDAGFIM